LERSAVRVEKLHNEKQRDVYLSPNKIGMINERGMSCVGHGARMKKKEKARVKETNRKIKT
jgi:hypothetical protein